MIISQAQEVSPEGANASARAFPPARRFSTGLSLELHCLSFGSLASNFLPSRQPQTCTFLQNKCLFPPGGYPLWPSGLETGFGGISKAVCPWGWEKVSTGRNAALSSGGAAGLSSPARGHEGDEGDGPIWSQPFTRIPGPGAIS